MKVIDFYLNQKTKCFYYIKPLFVINFKAWQFIS